MPVPGATPSGVDHCDGTSGRACLSSRCGSCAGLATARHSEVCPRGAGGRARSCWVSVLSGGRMCSDLLTARGSPTAATVYLAMSSSVLITPARRAPRARAPRAGQNRRAACRCVAPRARLRSENEAGQAGSRRVCSRAAPLDAAGGGAAAARSLPLNLQEARAAGARGRTGRVAVAVEGDGRAARHHGRHRVQLADRAQAVGPVPRKPCRPRTGSPTAPAQRRAQPNRRRVFWADRPCGAARGVPTAGMA
jgi:hypothetical protein